jgi:hypothetical protein
MSTCPLVMEQILAFFIHQKHESVSSSDRASFRAGRQGMRARRMLVRRQKGTKKCVADMALSSGLRYRHDVESHLRFAGIELIIEHASWLPPKMTGATPGGVMGGRVGTATIGQTSRWEVEPVRVS